VNNIMIRALLILIATLLLLNLEGATAQVSEIALSGRIDSDREGPMEGVLVSAKKTGSTITVSVMSNASGEYSFPASRLDEGTYDLTIKATGYVLEPISKISLTQGKAAKVDLRLRPTQQLGEQLTNAEWMANAPGSDDIKRLLLNCGDCHSIQRIFESKHSPSDFLKVFDRMAGYYPGASDLQPQRLIGSHRRPAVPSGMEQKFAGYLASINLFDREKRTYELKPFPRPAGRATKVIVTEYDLPRKEIQPHDVVVDPDGMVWYSHFGEQFLSKLDPRTGKIADFPIPVQKPGYPVGTLDLEVDQDGNIWVGLMYQSGVAKLDRATNAFRIYPLPGEWQTEATQQSHFSVAATKVDGKVWVKNSDRSQVMRLDVETGRYENLGTFLNPETQRPIGIYGIYADQQNNVYILEFPFGGIGKIDAKTGKLAFYPAPTANSRARRGRVDSQNRLWFAEFGSNGVGMFDPIAEKITEWKMPLPWEAPYDVVADRNGEVWEVNESSDRVGRLNPRTGEWTNYLLPRNGNIRRVFVDDRTKPVTIWIGANLGAAIVKIEPLD
jgi:virginiamycin B lyase